MNLKQAFSILVVSSFIAFGAVSCKSKVSDTDLKAQVESVVSSNPNVTVDVKDGVVTLSGIVNTEEERQALEASAKTTKGIKSVVNNITVQPPIEINTDDADLSAKVIDATKDFPTVSVSVKDGIITVTGSVEQARVQVLKQSLDALNPKKVDMSALTVK